MDMFIPEQLLKLTPKLVSSGLTFPANSPGLAFLAGAPLFFGPPF